MNCVLAVIAAMIMWLWAPVQVGASESFWFSPSGEQRQVQAQPQAMRGPVKVKRREARIKTKKPKPAVVEQGQRRQAWKAKKRFKPRNASQARQRRQSTQQGYSWTRYNRDKHGQRKPYRAIRNFSLNQDQKQAVERKWETTTNPEVVTITHLQEMQNKSGLKKDVTAAFPPGVEVKAKYYPTDQGIALFEPFKVIDNGCEVDGCWNWGWDYLPGPKPEIPAEIIEAPLPPPAEPVVWQGKVVPQAKECAFRPELDDNFYAQARFPLGEGGPNFFAGNKLRAYLKRSKTSAGTLRVGPAFSSDWWHIATKDAKNDGHRYVPGIGLNFYRMQSKYDKDWSATAFFGYGWGKDETWTNDRKFHSVHRANDLHPEIAIEKWFKDGINNPYENPEEWPLFERIKMNAWLGAHIETSYDDQTTWEGRPLEDYKPDSRTSIYAGGEFYGMHVPKIKSMLGGFVQADHSLGDRSIGIDGGLVLSRYDEIAKIKAGGGIRFASKNKDGNGSSLLVGVDLDLGAMARKGLRKMEKWQREREEKTGPAGPREIEIKPETEPRVRLAMASTNSNGNNEEATNLFTGASQISKADANDKPANGQPDYSLLRYNPIGDH